MQIVRHARHRLQVTLGVISVRLLRRWHQLCWPFEAKFLRLFTFESLAVVLAWLTLLVGGEESEGLGIWALTTGT